MGKKLIKRNLGVDVYKIVESYSLKDDFHTCENCGKLIKNVAIVEDSNGRRFAVGMDCAATLSGITEFDILRFSAPFERAKSIRAKINKEKKSGSVVEVGVSLFDDGLLYIAIYKKERFIKRPILKYWDEIDTEFINKYLPEYS